PLPYVEPQRLAFVGGGSAGEYLALRERLRGFSQLAAITQQTHPIDDGTETSLLDGAAVTTNLLTTLGVRPAIGRDFSDAEGVVGANHVLILSDALWRARFGAKRSALGKRV